MKKVDPDLIKIVTKAEKYTDNLRLLSLYDEGDFSDRLIAFCMGNKGKISRLMSLFYSPIAYVTIESKKTAPGQLCLEDLEEISEVFI